jgi:hypothetical protein
MIDLGEKLNYAFEWRHEIESTTPFWYNTLPRDAGILYNYYNMIHTPNPIVITKQGMYNKDD